MAKEYETASFVLGLTDLSIIDQHNQDLANPGRSAALRHIIREWASRNPVAVPIVGIIKDEKVVLTDPQLGRD